MAGWKRKKLKHRGQFFQGVGHLYILLPLATHHTTLLQVVKQGDEWAPEVLDVIKDNELLVVADGLMEVKNGDSIGLGAYTLNFVLTPMVHWPETMMTLCTTGQPQAPTTPISSATSSVTRASSSVLPPTTPGSITK